MRIHADRFRVPPGKKIDLSRWPTRVKPEYRSDKQYRKILKHHVERLSTLQELLYASDRHAVLVIFQALDAAGKDGAIKHVMSGVNPQGVQVTSFKHPSATELQHDFLWRTTLELPARGRIGIFNRSYYEEVLITRVHPQLLEAEAVPGERAGRPGFWRHRYRSIVSFERHLSGNGTRIVKFFLHLSQEEQRRRFLARIDEPTKQWKLSMADIQERRFFKHYRKAYEECLSATSSEQAPWYAVPADDKENARLIVSQAILDTLESLDMSYPKSTPQRLKELERIRGQLTA